LSGALLELRAARDLYKQLLDIDRDNSGWRNALASDHRAIGVVLEQMGDLEGARSELQATIELRQGLVGLQQGASDYERYLAGDHVTLGSILKRLNDHEGARRHLELSAEGFSRVALIAPDFYNAACAYALAGKPSEAFAMLDQAIEKGYRDAAHAKRDPDLATLRTDPRWKPLIERMAAR
jgi:tetratricopeptide (TPR) repeat protein